MKRLSFLLAIVFMAGMVNAQSIKLYYAEDYQQGGEVTEDTITIDYTTYGIDIAYWMYVGNTSENNVDIVLTKTIIDTVPGSQVRFCWGSCVGAEVYVSDPVELAPGASDVFQAEYMMNSGSGNTVVRYTFTNANDTSDYTSIVLVYRTTVGIAEAPVMNVRTYPNPVVNKVYVAGASHNALVSLYDILGNQIIADTRANSIDMSNLSAGIYMIQIKEGNRISTKKIIKK